MSHKINTLSIVAWYLLAATFATVANAEDTYDQNFDSWAGGTAPTNYYLNTPDGWSISNAQVTTLYGPASPSNAAWLASPIADTNTAKPWVMSPLLSNGFGRIQWASKIQQAGTNIYDVQWSTNATAWNPLGTYTNTNATTWVTNQIATTNVYVPSYVRVRKIQDNTTNKRLGIDNVNIALPVSYVTITNQALTPAQPLAGQPTEISVQILPLAFATNIQATVFYWTNIDALTTSSVNMAYLGTNTFSTTATNGILAEIPGTVVSYYIRAVFDGPSSNGITQYWPSTWPSTPDQFMARVGTPASIYTNMMLNGPPTTNLQLVADNNWAGATPKSSYTNPALTFVSGTNTWGDTDESASFPLEGTAALNPNPISISGIITSRLYASFVETNLAYAIERCNYVDFDSWGSAEAYGVYTNNEGWQIVTGRTTTAAEQSTKAYQGTGRSLVLGNNNTNSYIRSPYLPNNMGLLVMRYRHYNENGSARAALRVEASFNITNGWLPVLEINPIYSPDYVYAAYGISDISNHYFRIRNASTNNSEICIDEITITDPGALVILSNKQISPSSPLGSEPVAIQVNYLLFGGATNQKAKVYWKSPDTQIWTWQYLTDDGTNKFYGILPPTVAGTNEYYISCDYEGLHASTVYVPQGGPSAPDYYVVSTQYSGGTRIQSFDTWAGGTALTNYYLNPDGWSISNAQVTTLYTPASSPKAAWLTTPLADTNPAKPWIMSPLLTNGFGQIQWASRIQAVPGTNIYDVQWSTNASAWTPLGTFTNDDSSSWVTNQIVNNYVHVPSYVRIRKIHDFSASNRRLGIDDIIITPPLADVVITNLFSSPGYPGTGDTVRIWCDISSRDDIYKAYDFRPTLAYRPINGSWTITNMWQVDSNTWTTAIPPQPATSIVQYFIRCDFAGFYYTNGAVLVKNSPAFYPDGPSTQNEPDSFMDYLPRRFASEYSSVSASSSVGNVSMILVGSNTWQGISTNYNSPQMLINFSGLGYFTGSGFSSGTNFWGDNSQVLFDTPLSGTASQNASNIVVNINTSSMSQVLILFNSNNGYYEVRRGAYQDFNGWRDVSADKFESSLSRSGVTIISNNFNSWPTNSIVTRPEPNGAGQANFQDAGWLNPTATTDYVSGPVAPADYDVNDGYNVENFKIVREVGTNVAVEFKPIPDSGATWPNKSVLTDGLKELTWKVRCYFPEHYHTSYTNASALTWTNYYVKANLIGSDAGSAFPTLSLFAYYKNASNYYECYLMQTNTGATPQGEFGIRSMINGTKTRLSSTTWNTSTAIETGGDITLSISTRTTNSVYLRAFLSSGNRLLEHVHTSTNLIGGGSIGLLTADAEISADNIEVKDQILNSFNGFADGASSSFSNIGWDYSDCQRWTDGSCYVNYGTAAGITSPVLPFVISQLDMNFTLAGGSNAVLNVEGFNGSIWTNIATYVGFTGWTAPSISSGLTGFTRLRFVNGNITARIRIDYINITGQNAKYTEDFSVAATNWHAPSGFWNVNSGVYKRQAYCGPALQYKIQTSTNMSFEFYPPLGATYWADVSTTFTVSNHIYEQKSHQFYYYTNLFTRLQHTTGSASLRFDDITMSSWRAPTFESNEWRMVDGWVANAGAGKKQIELQRSRSDPANNQSVRTPFMTNGVGAITFVYAFEGLNGSNATFDIQYSYTTNGSPTATNSYTVSDTSTYTNVLKFNSPLPRFVHIGHTSSNSTAVMKIYNVEITDYTARDDKTWEAYNVLITDNQTAREFEPQATNSVKTAYLNLDANSDTLGGPFTNSAPYIQSAKLKEGIGRVSFWYRLWDAANPPGKIVIYTSDHETSTNWTERASITNINNTDYSLFSTNWYWESNYFVRVTSSTNSPSSRICIDNVLVAEPFAANFTIQKIEITPAIPLPTDSVKIAAEIGRYIMDPHTITAKAYYQIGTNNWGTWVPANYIDMNITASNSTSMRFESISNIPPQNIDTVVQYYVEFTFDGTFADITSPKEGRVFTNPSWYAPVNLNSNKSDPNPYYVVFSCGTNAVWINEFNYGIFNDPEGDHTNEFVELAGVDGSDITGWKIELLKTGDASVYDQITITNSFVFNNETNGFGFYVWGDSNVAAADSVFSTPSTNYNLDQKGAISLKRSMGAWVDRVAYGTDIAIFTNNGYKYAGAKASMASLLLAGTGSSKNEFTWTQMTEFIDDPPVYADPDFGVGVTFAGTANGYPGYTQQVFVAVSYPEDSIIISNFWITASNTYLVFTSTITNEFTPKAWYTTNLINTNWAFISSSYNYSPASGIYTQYFPNITNTPPIYFRVTSTNSP